MKQQVTIIPAADLISVDGRILEIGFAAPANVHALQWQGNQGHIEFNDGRANQILTADDYALEVQPYVDLWEAEAARLDSRPGPAYDWNAETGEWVYNLEKDSPGPEYRLIDGVWRKVIFSKKDFLLKCGFQQIADLNAAINTGNVMAKTVHDLLFASDYIDLTDAATVQMVNLLATEGAGSVLTAEDVERILTGVPYEAAA